MEKIYHYTAGDYLQTILESKFLKVSEWERKNNVKPPALWLSLNPIWENTATKLINDYGVSRKLTKEEQYENSGLVRFELEFKKESLCSWGAYKHKSNTPINVYFAMEKAGTIQNANPNEWYASFKNIPLVNCISCQKWNGNEWETIVEFQKIV